MKSINWSLFHSALEKIDWKFTVKNCRGAQLQINEWSMSYNRIEPWFGGCLKVNKLGEGVYKVR